MGIPSSRAKPLGSLATIAFGSSKKSPPPEGGEVKRLTNRALGIESVAVHLAGR